MKEYTREQIRNMADYLTGTDFWHAGNLRFADGPSGLRVQAGKGDSMGLNKSLPATGFPTHTALACSWNRGLAYGVALRMGAEAAAQGVDVLLAPAVNIKRSPYNGRNFEYFSEDPYLSGEFGAAFVKGVQSQGVGACVKHFAANNKETGRSVSDSIISERTLRELYLPAFEKVVKTSSPAAVMTSYNKINGEYVNESRRLISGVLRGEWGFKGFVVSDWGGTCNRPAAVKAGADLEMPACKFSSEEIVEAFERGELSGEEIEECVNRVRAARSAPKPAKVPMELTEHARFAERAASECAVLLKNDGVLPLEAGVRIAVFGRAAKDAPVQGGGSSHVIYGEPLKNILTALGERFTVVGYRGKYKKLNRSAKKLASRADAIVVCLAAYRGDSEGDDKTTLSLPNDQLELVASLKETGKKVICILTSGGALDTSWDSSVNALLYLGLAGQGSAYAAADILCGRVNPSGRLAESFFNSAEELPANKNFHQSPYFSLYSEGMSVGYRYYLSSGAKPKYAFGYGLGYTEFSVTDPEYSNGGVSVTVKNTGHRGGAEVVQIYLGFPAAAHCVSPVLAGFEKVFLRPGEERRLFIPTGDEVFRSYDVSLGKWVTVGGEYTLYVAESSQNFLCSVTVEKEGVQGVPADEFTGKEPPPYPISRNKRGRVVADISTPFGELKNSRALLVRWVSRIALFHFRNNATLGGTLRYATIRMGAQFGGFTVRRKQGIVDLFNGRYLRGAVRFIFKGKGAGKGNKRKDKKDE